MATLVERFTAEANAVGPPLLILALEDLHWADYSRLALLSALAQRREPARLLLIATYRTTDIHAQANPLGTLARDLLNHRVCHELALDPLTEDAVVTYVSTRCGAENPDAMRHLGRALHARTEGHPLFLETILDDLLARDSDGALLDRDPKSIATSVPESLRQTIALQLDRLSPDEQRLLEAAAVAGAEFSAAAAAAALDRDVLEVEDACADLARRQQFLTFSGVATWPDATVAARFRFRHSLHQSVLYERTAGARRLRFHQKIGEREEAAYGTLAAQIGAELAVHFEQARDFRRAVGYLGHAAESAVRKYAYREAADLVHRALALLETWPDSPARDGQELALQVTLGIALVMTKGFTVPEVERAYERAHELCRQIGETPRLFAVLEGLQTFYAVRGDLEKACSLAQLLLDLAHRAESPALMLEAHHTLGGSIIMRGECRQARYHLEQAIAIYDPGEHAAHAFLFSGHDPGVCCRCYLAFTLWTEGWPDRALARAEEGLRLARKVAHPYSVALALYLKAFLHYLRREPQLTLDLASESTALASEEGFPYWVVISMILRGWALAELGQSADGVVLIRQGLAACQAMGTGLARSAALAQLAEAAAKAGDFPAAFEALNDAFAWVRQTGERNYEAEICRLHGEIAGEEKSLLEAIEIARRQSAASFELRAISSLVRRRPTEAALSMLTECFGRFSEGFDTADLRAAGELLRRGSF